MHISMGGRVLLYINARECGVWSCFRGLSVWTLPTVLIVVLVKAKKCSKRNEKLNRVDPCDGDSHGHPWFI